MKLKYIVTKLEKFTSFDFSEKKEFSFNASLIIRNKVSNGVIILGSNNYKYKVENLESLDTIVNIIGEYPAKEFEKEKSLHFEEFKEKYCKEVFETIVVTKTGHSVCCYTKPNENFSSYHYLADVIHKHLWKGDRILVHCQMGHVRSATLLVFYLRKYFFENVNEANEFVGLKREKAGAPSMLLNNIEHMVKEKK
jgi:protein-tyrosine phosphatase